MEITKDRTILGLVLVSWVARTTFALNSNNSSKEICFPGNINNNNLTLNGARGTFQSPKGYPVNSSCDWLLTVPEGNTVKLVFDTFYLKFDRYPWGCLRDYVEVLDGNSSSSASKGRFCGLGNPGVIRSSGRYMWVRFRTDSESSWHTGFMATFTAEDKFACPYHGRILHASASYRTITSPNFPSSYYKNEQCKWILEALGGFIVKVTFNDFQLQGAIYGDCNDKLTFYDGNSTASKLLGKVYCGSTRPDVIYSTGRYLLVEFKTDGHINYKGFKFHFLAVNKEEASGICRTSSCKVHQLSGSTGTFFTPYYPMPYPEQWTCIWQISVPSGKRVKLNFQEFDIDPDDSLQIRDGKLSQSAELHHYRGEDVYSSGSYMRVEFYSRSIRSWYFGRKGFKARFEAIGLPGNPKEFCFLGNIYNNNLKLTGSSGTLQSPEERYPSHLSCTWLITVPDGKNVRLSFQRFRLPGSASSKCTPDYVEILDGKYSYSESRGRLCGDKKPEDILSSGRYMTVRFRSGDIKSFHDGFEATFAAENAPVEPVAVSSSRELCLPGNVNNENLKLTGTDGTLQMPLKFYPPNLVCIWLITVPEEKMVQLSFERFDLDPNGCFDYVEIRDGKDNEGSSLGTYCGTDSIPQKIQSSDRYMWIRFHSDYEAGVSRTGFKATFKAISISKPKTLVIAVAVVAGLVVLIALICCVMCVRKRRNKRGEAGGERIPMTPATTSAFRPTQSEAIYTTPPPVGYAPVPTNRESTTHLLSNQVELPPPYPGTG